MKKEFYLAPESEVLALRLEGVIATSFGSEDDQLPGYLPGQDL